MTIMMAASLAISAATAITGVAGAQQQAQAQADVQKQTAEAAVKNSINQYGTVQRRTLEERSAAAAALENNSIEAAQARSRAKVAASAAGVTGLSVNNLIADVFNQQGRRDQATRTNLGYTEAQLRDEQTSIYSQAQSAVNQGRTPIIAPGYATAALQILGDGLDAYNTYKPPTT